MRSGITATGVVATLILSSLPVTSASASGPQLEKYNYPLAKSSTEEKFIEIADKSCKLAIKNGFVLTESGYTTIYPPQPAVATPSMLAQPSSYATLDSTGKPVSRYYDFMPSVCEPSFLNDQVPLLKPGMKTTEHRLTKLSATKFAWYSHHGGADLNKTVFTLAKGLISGWSLWTGSTFKVQYGPLTQQQLAAFDQAGGH